MINLPDVGYTPANYKALVRLTRLTNAEFYRTFDIPEQTFYKYYAGTRTMKWQDWQALLETVKQHLTMEQNKMKYSITGIQFFPCDTTEQVSENEFIESKSYSANIIINDSFIIQASGDLNECSWSIPEAKEAKWNSDKAQDDAYANVDKDELIAFLKSDGIENNYFWLNENSDELY